MNPTDSESANSDQNPSDELWEFHESNQTRQRFSGPSISNNPTVAAGRVPEIQNRIFEPPNAVNRRERSPFVLDMPAGPVRNEVEQFARRIHLERHMPQLEQVFAEQQQQNPGQNPQNQQQQNEENEGAASSWTGFFRQLMTTNPEVAGVVAAFESYIPFILILAIKQLFDYSTGIFVFLALLGTFYHANSVVCREVSRNGRRASWPLIIVMVNLVACIGLIYFVFEDEKLYLCAIFIPSGRVATLSELLWIVGVNDFILKFVSVIIKIFVILLPSTILQHRKRGNYFLFIELSSQLHRTLVPIPVWLFYLLDSKDRIPSKVLGVILTAAYMVFKGKSILRTALAWKLAASKLLQSTRYGKSPSHEELKATGGTCPICHDSLSEPTKLHCKHIFCEECVSTWFDREKTCPMCRAQVTEDPAWRDGSTSQFIQLF